MATLIYHAGALGDFITALPALRFWKSRHTAEKAVLLGIPAAGELAGETGAADEFFDVSSRAFLPLFHDRFSGEAGKILSPFGSAIVFCDNDSPLIRNIRSSGIKNIHWQPPFPETKIHAADYHLSLFADPQSFDLEIRTPRIYPSAKSLAAASVFLPKGAKPVAIHPGSGSVKKNWPFGRFLDLARLLKRNSFEIMWIKGPAEESFNFPETDSVATGLPLPVLAALLSQCRAFIGNDSGVTHLAAAVNCPTVAIFGPSDPAVWGPRGSEVSIVHERCSCAPCHRTARRDEICDGTCLTAITVRKVRERIRRIKPY